MVLVCANADAPIELAPWQLDDPGSGLGDLLCHQSPARATWGPRHRRQRHRRCNVERVNWWRTFCHSSGWLHTCAGWIRWVASRLNEHSLAYGWVEFGWGSGCCLGWKGECGRRICGGWRDCSIHRRRGIHWWREDHRRRICNGWQLCIGRSDRRNERHESRRRRIIDGWRNLYRRHEGHRRICLRRRWSRRWWRRNPGWHRWGFRHCHRRHRLQRGCSVCAQSRHSRAWVLIGGHWRRLRARQFTAKMGPAFARSLHQIRLR